LGLGKFWSSCDGKAVRGIEYSCVALINPDLPGAYHLSASQTPPDGNRVDFYIRQLQILKQHYSDSAKHIVADGYYANLKIPTSSEKSSKSDVSPLKFVRSIVT
jgi:hypothetical protein